MGVTAPDQPPEILWPPEGAASVPTDARAWGRGGTVAPEADGGPSGHFAFEHDRGTVGARLDVVGHDETDGPLGVESVPALSVRPLELLPPRTDVRLVFRCAAREPRTLRRFTTGEGPGSAVPMPRRVPPPAPPPGVPAFAPPRRGMTGALLPFALELPAGPWVVVVEARARLARVAVGPSLYAAQAEAAQDGRATVRVLDSAAREVLRLSLP